MHDDFAAKISIFGLHFINKNGVVQTTSINQFNHLNQLFVSFSELNQQFVIQKVLQCLQLKMCCIAAYNSISEIYNTEKFLLTLLHSALLFIALMHILVF